VLIMRGRVVPVKIGLLGTGFGIAHAQIYHRHPDVDDVLVFGRTATKLDDLARDLGFDTTTEIDQIYDDPTIELVDVCLPAPLHADHVVRALQAGKHVLCELPLAPTIADAQRVIDAQVHSDRQVFVDMFGRFDPATEFLHETIRQRPHGELKTLHVELRTALLWEGHNLGLDTIAIDMMHSSLDTIVTVLDRPDSITALGVARHAGGSAAEVLLAYPGMIVQYSASALMPKPYGVRGGWRATFTDAVVESTWTAGYDGRPTNSALTEYSETGRRDVALPRVDAYTAVIDHVIACCKGHASNRLNPATVLDSLHVTLDVQHALTNHNPAGAVSSAEM
jgi:predicted dehydrogenase